MYTDIHSHILPNVDDGAKSEKESLQILQSMAKQGITSVVVTPHFYSLNCYEPKVHKENLKKVFEGLLNKAKNIVPNIILGHEVHYFKGISSCEEIKELTMGESSYILIELPMCNFKDDVADEIMALALDFGLKPIIAHVERYAFAEGFRSILKLVESGLAIAHVNCDSIVDRRTRKNALNLIKYGFASFITTDAHSIKKRPPLMDKALKIIENKLGAEVREKLRLNANNLFKNIEGKV